MFRKFFVPFLFFCLVSLPYLFAGEAKSIAGISFQAPDSWKEAEPTSSMRAFQFEVPGPDDQKGEMAVFYFGAGQGGDLEENINRWKKQFTKLENENREKKTVDGLNVTEVFLQGSYQLSGGPMMMVQGEPKENYAVLGAIIEAPQGSVFLKMTGPKDLAAAAKPDFDTLLTNLKKAS